MKRAASFGVAYIRIGGINMAVNWGAVETMKGWSTADQAKYAQNKSEWENTTDENRRKLLNDENIKLRAKYGLAEDNINAKDAKSAFEFNTQAGNEYLRKGATLDFDVDKSRVNKVKDQIEKFEYNPETDPAFKAYREQANREGESAAKSTLNQLNAASMGRNNSFSSAATAQVQQAYSQKVSEKAAELAEIAYQKLLDRYNIEMADYENEYARKNDEFNRNMDMADRSFNHYATFNEIDKSDEMHDINKETAGLQNDLLEKEVHYYDTDKEHQYAESEASTRGQIAGAVGQEMANARYNEIVDADLEQQRVATDYDKARITTEEIENGTYEDETKYTAESYLNALKNSGYVDNLGMTTVYSNGKPVMMSASLVASMMESGTIIYDNETGNLIKKQ